MKKSNAIKDESLVIAFKRLRKIHPELCTLLPKQELVMTSAGQLLTEGIITRIVPLFLAAHKKPARFKVLPKVEMDGFASELKIFDDVIGDWIYVETNGHDPDLELDNDDELPAEKMDRMSEAMLQKKKSEIERGDLDQKKLAIPFEKKETPVFVPQLETTPQPEKVITSAGGNELINCQTEVTVVSPGAIKTDVDITRYFEQSDPFYLATVTFVNSISNPNTQRAYKVSLNEFFSLFDRIHPRDILVSHLELYKKYLAEKNQPATVVVKLSALSKYFQYLAQPQGSSVPPLIAYNPMEAVKFPKVEMYDRSKKITIEQSRSVLAQIDTAEPAGARDYCIIYWMMLTGRRINEILMLRKKDLYTTGSKIYYNFAVEKSTGHDNEELPQPVWDALRFYWQQSSRSINDNSPLFVGHSNNNVTEEPISDSAIRQKLDFYCIAAGISPREVSPHSFRHLHAQLLENSGVSVREIQKRLHHKNLNTTQVYLDKIVDKDNDYWKQIDTQINA